MIHTKESSETDRRTIVSHLLCGNTVPSLLQIDGTYRNWVFKVRRSSGVVTSEGPIIGVLD